HKVILGCADEAAAVALIQAMNPGILLGDVIALPEAQVVPWLLARSDRRGYTLHDAINFSPPDGVRAELKKGLQWHKEGH
ncbi:hypothetical protein LAJ56_17750, partial [Streptococcus pneumoniae]|nr:hypothetical protein [Streptococcus pneumoniae]